LGITVDPTGKFAYVTNYEGFTVSGYEINPSTGGLTAVPGSPFAAGEGPTSVTVDPSGKFVYLSDDFANGQQVNGVWAYGIDNATGTLTGLPGSPFLSGAFTPSIVVSGEIH